VWQVLEVTLNDTDDNIIHDGLFEFSKGLPYLRLFTVHTTSYLPGSSFYNIPWPGIVYICSLLLWPGIVYICSLLFTKNLEQVTTKRCLSSNSY